MEKPPRCCLIVSFFSPMCHFSNPELGAHTDHESLSAVTPHSPTGTGWVWGQETFLPASLSCPEHTGVCLFVLQKATRLSFFELSEDFPAPHFPCLDTSGTTVTPGNIRASCSSLLAQPQLRQFWTRSGVPMGPHVCPVPAQCGGDTVTRRCCSRPLTPSRAGAGGAGISHQKFRIS